MRLVKQSEEWTSADLGGEKSDPLSRSTPESSLLVRPCQATVKHKAEGEVSRDEGKSYYIVLILTLYEILEISALI